MLATLFALVWSSGAFGQQADLEAFKKHCLERHGEFRPGGATAASCGLARAPDATARCCFTATVDTPLDAGRGRGLLDDEALVRAFTALVSCTEPRDPTVGDCAACRNSPRCLPAAGDFGPMECRCGVFEKTEEFLRVVPEWILSDVTVSPPGDGRVRRVLEGSLRRARPCLQPRTTAVSFSFSILESGRTQNLTLLKEKNPELEACLDAVATKFLFPRSKGPKRVTSTLLPPAAQTDRTTDGGVAE